MAIPIPLPPETQPAPESTRPPPRVGEIVLFRMAAGPREGEQRPAIVVRVNPGGTLNLHVIRDGGNDDDSYDSRTSPVACWRGTVPEGDTPGTWQRRE